MLNARILIVTSGNAFLLQTISLGRRGPNNVDQSTTQGPKGGLKGNRKAHHSEHPSQKAGSSVTSSSSADAATPEEGPGSTTSTVEPSAPAGGSEGGVRHVPGNGGSNERSRGGYWRGQDNPGFGGPRQRNGRDQVRSNNHQWNNQRGFRMNNGPAVAMRAGSNRNYNNRNMFNNNMSEFGNPAGVIHVLVRLFFLMPVTTLSEVCFVHGFGQVRRALLSPLDIRRHGLVFSSFTLFFMMQYRSFCTCFGQVDCAPHVFLW